MSQWEVELGHEESRKLFSRHSKGIVAGILVAASIMIVIFIIFPYYNSDLPEKNDNYASNLPSFDSSDFISNDYKIYTTQIDSLISVSSMKKRCQ